MAPQPDWFLFFCGTGRIAPHDSVSHSSMHRKGCTFLFVPCPDLQAVPVAIAETMSTRPRPAVAAKPQSKTLPDKIINIHDTFNFFLNRGGVIHAVIGNIR